MRSCRTFPCFVGISAVFGAFKSKFTICPVRATMALARLQKHDILKGTCSVSGKRSLSRQVRAPKVSPEFCGTFGDQEGSAEGFSQRKAIRRKVLQNAKRFCRTLRAKHSISAHANSSSTNFNTKNAMTKGTCMADLKWISTKGDQTPFKAQTSMFYTPPSGAA